VLIRIDLVSEGGRLSSGLEAMNKINREVISYFQMQRGVLSNGPEATAAGKSLIRQVGVMEKPKTWY
jgi:hypothetical protein